MTSKSTATTVMALLAGLACGGARSPATSALQARGDAFLVVTNDHYLDAAIYAVRSGIRQRIGTVTGFGTDTIPLRGTIVGGPTLRLLVAPIGLNRRHVTEPIHVRPSEMVELRIQSQLNLSSVTVWRR